jgi:hypothetical protein
MDMLAIFCYYCVIRVNGTFALNEILRHYEQAPKVQEPRRAPKLCQENVQNDYGIAPQLLLVWLLMC